MRFEVDDRVRKAAKWPHEVILINLITNHVLLFVGLLGMVKTFPLALLSVPAISLATLGYVLLGARKAFASQPWYVACHWHIAARRSRLFILMLVVMALVIVVVAIWSGGHLKPQHWALGGAGILPVMGAVLLLIVLEQDAMHQANNGLIAQWVVDRFPPPADAKLVDESFEEQEV